MAVLPNSFLSPAALLEVYNVEGMIGHRHFRDWLSSSLAFITHHVKVSMNALGGHFSSLMFKVKVRAHLAGAWQMPSDLRRIKIVPAPDRGSSGPALYQDCHHSPGYGINCVPCSIQAKVVVDRKEGQAVSVGWQKSIYADEVILIGTESSLDIIHCWLFSLPRFPNILILSFFLSCVAAQQFFFYFKLTIFNP